jgi:hypothetical protein
MESVNVQYKKRSVIEFLFAEKVREKHPQMSLQCLGKCCGRLKHRWSLGGRCDGFQNRESRAPCFASSGCPVIAVSSEVLLRADAIVRED